MARLRDQFGMGGDEGGDYPVSAPNPDRTQFQPSGEAWNEGLTPGGSGLPTVGPGGREGETPRERASEGRPGGGGMGGGGDVRLRTAGAGGGDGATQATPRRPSSPSPMAGSTFTPASGGATGVGGSPGVVPFEPMSSPNVGSLTTPVGGGLYGGAGGLTGGGLGVPLDPISNQQSSPLDMLLQIIKGNGGR